MLISGSVENIIFRNPENGYSVVEIDSGGNPVTCVGNFPLLLEGQEIEVEGEFKTGKYGEQFSCRIIKYNPPRSAEAITRYLASGLVKGVGPVTASAIVSRFGSRTLDIIEFEPSRLSEVRGISVKKAGEIGACVLKLKDMQSAVMFLQQYNVTVNMALKIYGVYEDNTENVLKENPYRLVEDVDGIGFLTADKIAASMGIEKHSEFRIRAGLIYALRDIAENSGSTYIPKDGLLSGLTALLGIDFASEENQKIIDGIIDSLVIDGGLKDFEKDGVSCIMLSKFYNMEKSIAARLVRLNNFCCEIENDVSFFISEFERINGIKLHGAQINAVSAAVSSGVAVVTGGPGTGKTTIIKCILSIFKHNNLKTLLCAPTGRAAKRLNESTGEEAKTIHRLLDLDFKNHGYFTYNENTRLDADVVIVDEVSMVDGYLFNSLVKALNDGTRLILVGDKDQLPSVGAGNVLSEIIKSGRVNVQLLTEIYRQSSDSLISVNAHCINSGIMPDLTNKSSDFFFIEKRSPQEILDTVTELCTKRLPSYINLPPSSIQVLSPMKKGLSGVESLNRRLQELLNPNENGKKELICEGKIFRAGDKVMQTVNNYKLEWYKNTLPFENGEGVFNGDIGYITDIAGEYELTVEFEDGRVADYSAADINDLTLAYAISVHKSQGCEFDAAVIPVTGGPPTLLTKNLLYTAITRAKKLVVLVGSSFMVEKMVKNNYTQLRYSFLSDFIIESDNVLKGLCE